jgi:hypothetical protein
MTRIHRLEQIERSPVLRSRSRKTLKKGTGSQTLERTNEYFVDSVCVVIWPS